MLANPTPNAKSYKLYGIIGLVLLVIVLIAFWVVFSNESWWNTMTAHLYAAAASVDQRIFLIMLATGFVAQMADGALGLGYGTITTTILLSIGVNPAIVSSRVHTARLFTSGASGLSHHRFRNINFTLFKALAIPGVLGALLGACLAVYGKNYAGYIRLPISVYTFCLGYFIIKKIFRVRNPNDKVKRAGWLAGIGGFLDAFAGGGWGALVTSTLMSKRNNPRYVIGSVCLAEFFMVLASSVTFVLLLKTFPVIEVGGLIIGGLIAAPIAARLVGKLPVKAMYVAVGLLVMLTSLNMFCKALVLLIQHH